MTVAVRVGGPKPGIDGLESTPMHRTPTSPALPCALILLLTGFLILALSPSAHAFAPDPGGDENASLTKPPAGKELGFNDSFRLEGLGAAVQASLIAAVGGNAARMPVQWWGLEPARDQWNELLWAQYQSAYDDLLARGIRPHLSITHAPPWARDADYEGCLVRADCNYPPARDELGQWRELLAELATRFPEATLGIWNEPNHLGAWRSGVDPERYAELLAAAYDSVKEASPTTGVFGPALGAATKPGGLDYRTFLDRAYAAEPSFKDHADAIDIHLYPTRYLGTDSHFARVIDDIRQVRAAHGDDGLPIYVTEIGATTSGPIAVSPADQADFILRVTRKLLTMPDVSGVLVHRLVESASHLEDHHETGFGLLGHGSEPLLTPKPAYCALTRAAGTAYPGCTVRPPAVRGPKRSRARRITFRVSPRDATTGSVCRLDRGRFKACEGRYRTRRLKPGRHVLRVRATAGSGELSRRLIVRRFRVVR